MGDRQREAMAVATRRFWSTRTDVTMDQKLGWALAAYQDALAPWLHFGYENYLGIFSSRRVRPLTVRFGTSALYPEPTFLLVAWDADWREEREFDVRRMVPSLHEVWVVHLRDAERTHMWRAFADRESAEAFRQEMWAEETAPDKYEFFRYEVRSPT